MTEGSSLFFPRIHIKSSSETQGQLVGSIKCSWWKFTVRSGRNFHHEHFIDPTNCPWVSEDDIKYVAFMSLWPRTIRILISNWPSKAKISPVFLKVQAGKKTLSYHGHALVTLYVQFLYSDWSKFDRWVHAEKLCSILKVVYFDSWSWQSFVPTCDVFNCLFPLDVQNEMQLLSRVFCYSWLVCLLAFWLRNASLVKIQ